MFETKVFYDFYRARGGYSCIPLLLFVQFYSH